jgi:putative DNA primase/helicase
MEKNFANDKRPYIKDDYVNRKDVLQYVLSRILEEEPFYKLDTTEHCINLLETSNAN